MTDSSQQRAEDKKLEGYIDKVATNPIKQEESNNEKSDGIHLEPEKDNPYNVMMASCYIPLASDAIYTTVVMTNYYYVVMKNVASFEQL